MIVGLEGRDEIYGFGGDDVICGGAGMDLLHGGDDDDRIYPGLHIDDAWGGDGNDLMEASTRDDHLHGEAGNDVLIVDGAKRATLEGGAGNDRLEGSKARMVGGAGVDVFVGGGCSPGTPSYQCAVVLFPSPDPPAGAVVDLDAGTATGFGNDQLNGIARVDGGIGDDVLLGDVNYNVLRGEGGVDRISGRSGDDGLWAEHGVIHGNNGDDFGGHPQRTAVRR